MDAKPFPRAAPVRRIAVLIQNRTFLGTRILHVPLLDSLRTAHPDAQICVLSPYGQGEFFVQLGLADRGIAYCPNGLGLPFRLRRLRPDVVVSLRPRSEMAGLAVALSGARVRAGYALGLGRFGLTHAAARTAAEYRLFNYFRLLAPLGIAPRQKDYLLALATAGAHAAGDGARICLIPGGGAGAFKRWPVERFLETYRALATALGSAGACFLLGPDERLLQAPIRAALGDRAQILQDASLAACVAAIEASRLVIANDCGPCHLAQILEKPYVGVFANHDGGVQARIAEWFNPHPQARAVTTARTAPIVDIPAEQVVQAALAVAR